MIVFDCNFFVNWTIKNFDNRQSRILQPFIPNRK